MNHFANTVKLLTCSEVLSMVSILVILRAAGVEVSFSLLYTNLIPIYPPREREGWSARAEIGRSTVSTAAPSADIVQCGPLTKFYVFQKKKV